MPIKNDPEFDAILRKDFEDIINEIIDFLLKEMQESIDYWVYDAGVPSNPYTRRYDNGGFYGAYIKLDATVKASSFGTELSGEVKNDFSSMEHDPDNYVHGSNFSEFGDDIRPALAEIIIEGTSGPLFGNGFWRQRRNYFTPVYNLLMNGTIDKMIKDKMISRGMTL